MSSVPSPSPASLGAPGAESGSASAPGLVGRGPQIDVLRAPALRADLLPIDQPPTPPLAARTPRTSVVARLGAFVGAFIALLTVILIITMLMGPELAPRYGGPVVALGLMVGAVISYIVAEKLTAGRRELAELAPRRAVGALVGLALGVALVAVCTAVIALFGGYRIDGVTTPPLGVLGMTVLQAGLQAAIFEEITFRGIIYRYLELALGSWGAIALSGLLFGLVHLGNPGATWLGALCIAIEAGVLFAALYVHTRSLWVLMGLHAGWNLTEAFAGIPVSGTTQGAFLRTHQGGSALISGGPFGIEASLITVVLLGALAAWLLVRAHRQGLLVAPVWVRRRRVGSAVPQATLRPAPEAATSDTPRPSAPTM